MSRTLARYVITGAAVLGAAAITACGPAKSPPSGQPATPAAASPPGTPAASASTPASASPGTAAPATCASASLSVTVDVKQGSAAAGSAYYPIDFTNTGSTPCTLAGYPGVSVVTGKGGGNGAEIGAPASRNSGAPPATVTLPAGGDAHAVLQVVDAGNYSASACHPVTGHWLRIYPPGQTAALYAPFTAQVCSARLPAKLGSPLAVYPVRSGKGQQGQAP
jgi:hypothetical protein